jgi:hypothetical protein
MWYATGILLVALGAYVWLLLTIKARAAAARGPVPSQAAAPSQARPARERYAADASARTARAAYNGLTTLSEDPGAVVVRSGRSVGVVRV